MRLALILISAFVLCTGTALADKDKSIDEPIWHFFLSPDRETYPEQEPNDTCPGQQVSCGDVVDPAEINPGGDYDWYTFTANAGDHLTIGTDQASGGQPTVDTVIELFGDDCTTSLAYNDDGGPGLYSLIEFDASYTGTYNLKVRAFGGTQTGFYLCFFTCTVLAEGACCFADGSCQVLNMIDCGSSGGEYQGDGSSCDPNPCPQPPPPPENDTGEGAEEFGYAIERCTAGTLEGDHSDALNDYNQADNPNGSCTGYSTNGLDVVYYMDLEAGDVCDFMYWNFNCDNSFYILTDYNDQGTCVVGADQLVNEYEEILGWVVPATDRYYLILDAWSSGCGGPWTLDFSITCGAPEEACCFADGSCMMLPRQDCIDQGGDPQGPDTVCDPNPCEPITTEESTLGKIKGGYR
jgi:hypothetical protein